MQDEISSSLKNSQIDSDAISNALKGDSLAGQVNSYYSTTNNTYVNNFYNSNSAVNSSSVLGAESKTNINNRESTDSIASIRNESAVINSKLATKNEGNLLVDQTRVVTSNFKNLVNKIIPALETIISAVSAEKKSPNSKSADKTQTQSSNSISNVDKSLNEYEKSEINFSEAVNQLFNEQSKSTKTGSTSTDEAVSVKSKQLIESSTVNRLTQPDTSLQRSVTQLTQALPNSINNLSTIMSASTSKNNSSQSIINEGNKLDQSTNTIINQNQQNQPQAQPSPTKPEKVEQSSQMSDFYLQAIYSALMSGKVKVKLEYS